MKSYVSGFYVVVDNEILKVQSTQQALSNNSKIRFVHFISAHESI